MKKKFIAMMLATACIGIDTLNCASIVNAAEQDTAFIMGDVNNDGAFSVSDVVLLQKWLLAVPDTNLDNWKAANFCKDDRLDVFDLTLMKRAMLDGESDQPISPTTQDIGVNNTEEVIELLKNYNLTDYNEAYQKSLCKMFECFNEDGYIYHFADVENAITLRRDHPNAAIWLMPYADYEDAGILYHVVYQGKYYQVYYYFNDPVCAVSNLWEYIEQRLCIKNINVVDEKYGIVDNTNDEQSDISAYFTVDDTHYCKVKTYESKDALMDFLQVMNYEKLDITGNISTNPVTPMTSQPVWFNDIETAIEAIGNCDVSKYPEMYQENYSMMFKLFKNDEFIYQVKDNDFITTQEKRGTTLFPYAPYEDVGVGYYVTFNDNTYHIMFYTANEDFLAETDEIASYLQKRMGRSSDKVITVINQNISLLFADNGQTYANAFIDKNHYFDVVGAVTEEEMIEFLKAFEYEKTVF